MIHKVGLYTTRITVMNSLHVADDGFSHIPIIDISPLVKGRGDRYAVAAQIGQACHECGFF